MTGIRLIVVFTVSMLATLLLWALTVVFTDTHVVQTRLQSEAVQMTKSEYALAHKGLVNIAAVSSRLTALAQEGAEFAGAAEIYEFTGTDVAQILRGRIEAAAALVALLWVRFVSLAEASVLTLLFWAAALTDGLARRRLSSIGFAAPHPIVSIHMGNLALITPVLTVTVLALPFAGAVAAAAVLVLSGAVALSVWAAQFHRFD